MSDLDEFADASSLTFWNVKVPPAFFVSLPNLEFLDIRGGSATDLAPVAGLSRLRGLVLNQVRGLSHLDELAGLVGLEILSLYGLAHVKRLPSLRPLVHLRRVEIGQMRELSDLAGVAHAPGLEELFLVRRLPINADTMRPFFGHPTLKVFDWFWEDVPVSQASPVLEAMSHLPRARAVRPEQWLAEAPAAST
jgi:hypothetical protein